MYTYIASFTADLHLLSVGTTLISNKWYYTD